MLDPDVDEADDGGGADAGAAEAAGAALVLSLLLGAFASVEPPAGFDSDPNSDAELLPA